MMLKGFYNEETLNELLFNDSISRLEYIYHHSQEMIDEYTNFCKERALQQDEQTSNIFWDWRLQEEETEHSTD